MILYLATCGLFLALDALGLRYLVKPVFDRHVGARYAAPFRMAPALLFYLGYVAGLLYFVSVRALRAGNPLAALIGGALLGLMAYGSYEFTNYATLRDWSAQQVAVDTLWGGELTGVSAWAGVQVARLIG